MKFLKLYRELHTGRIFGKELARWPVCSAYWIDRDKTAGLGVNLPKYTHLDQYCGHIGQNQTVLDGFTYFPLILPYCY